jgi:cytochrome c biogenesis protein CcdA
MSTLFGPGDALVRPWIRLQGYIALVGGLVTVGVGVFRLEWERT